MTMIYSKANENISIPDAVVDNLVMQEYSAIKSWRCYLGLSQTDVANKMNIKQPTYAQLESNKKPTKKMLLRAADALGVSYAELDFYDTVLSG
jgi:transcriptional regulator with XRE-family HTH domain